MPDSHPGIHGPYGEPPDEAERRRLREEVARTHRPEALTTLEGHAAVTLSKPLLHWRHERVARFCIEPMKRPEQDRAPCAFCSGQHPKCHEGSILWSDDGFLRPIGHICARRFFADRDGGWNAIETAADLRDTAAEARDNLLLILPRIPAFRAEVAALAGAAAFAQRQKDKLRQGCPRLARMLADLAKSPGSHLRVEERVTDEVRRSAGGMRTASGGASEYETVIVGQIYGPAFVASSYSPLRSALDLQNGLVQAFGHGPDDEEAQFDRLCGVEAEGPDALVECWSAAAEVTAKLPGTWDEVRAAWDFLSPHNLKGLDTWGRQLGPQRFAEVRLTPTAVFLLYRQGGEAEHVTLDRPLVLRPEDVQAFPRERQQS